MNPSERVGSQSHRSEEYQFIADKQHQYIASFEPTSGRMRNELFPIGPLFHLAVQFLPEYVTKFERKLIFRNHPAPILNVSIDYLEDNSDTVTEDFVFPQQFVEEQDKAYWYKGLLALQEIATERLRRDIVENLCEKIPGMKRLLGPIAEDLGQLYDQNPDIMYIKWWITKIYGDDAVTFERELARAMLTGNYTDVNESLSFVEEVGNLDDFAWKLMETCQRMKGELPLASEEGASEVIEEGLMFGALDFDNGVIETQIISKIYHFEYVQKLFEQILELVPGKIHDLTFNAALITSGIRIPKSLQLYVQIVLHEMCHYFSMSKRRMGFFDLRE